MNKGTQRVARKKIQNEIEELLREKSCDEVQRKRKLIILINKSMLITTMFIIFFVCRFFITSSQISFQNYKNHGKESNKESS